MEYSIQKVAQEQTETKHTKYGIIHINRFSWNNAQQEQQNITPKVGTKASTTGTVYGIYDMAGGSWEYVAGCINGQENSKFGVPAGQSKYVDLYTNPGNTNTNYEGAHTGDATKETKRWNGEWFHSRCNSRKKV